MPVRRVVTGFDDEGKSIFASDGEVEPIVLSMGTGAPFVRVWGGDVVPTLPSDGTPPSQPSYFPPAGGYRFGFFTLPPAGTRPPADLDLDAAIAEMQEKLPGMLDHIEPDDPGMHTTDTVDFEVVISGEVVLELDDGVEKTLHVGDTVVQNGTRHRWHNRTDQPALLAVFIVGAERVPSS